MVHQLCHHRLPDLVEAFEFHPRPLADPPEPGSEGALGHHGLSALGGEDVTPLRILEIPLVAIVIADGGGLHVFLHPDLVSPPDGIQLAEGRGGAAGHFTGPFVMGLQDGCFRILFLAPLDSGLFASSSGIGCFGVPVTVLIFRVDIPFTTISAIEATRAASLRE